MALNRELHSISDDNVPKFGEFSWSQQIAKGKRQILSAEIVADQPSPKKMAIELTSDDEEGSPVVGQICNLVDGDDDDVEHQIEHPSVEYLNNGATIRVYEMPPDTDNIPDDIPCNQKDQEDNMKTEVTINRFPVYQLEGSAPFLNETLQLCMGRGLDQRYICSKVPINIMQNALFIVDFQCVRHHDVVAMDKGSFGRQSSPTRHVAIKVLPDGRVEDIKTVKFLGADALESGYEYYKIRRHYTWHKNISGLSRVITRLEYKNVLFRYGVVQFKMTDEDKSFASNFKPQTPKEKTPRATPRGSLDRRTHAQTETNPNPTQTLNLAPAYKSTPSLNVSALNSSQSPPRMPMEELFPETTQKEQTPTTPNGAASTAKSEIFQILKNADKPKPLPGGKVPDFSKLLNLLKCEDFLCDVSFVSNVTDNIMGLNPRTFAMGELQRHWLSTYCSGDNPKSIVNISTRYKVGRHYLTTLTCSLPIFVLRDDPSAKHPTVLLGLMTSMTNGSEDYEYLASNIRRQGIKSMVYGTDGDFSLDAALERTFPTQERSLLNSSSSAAEKSIHLCCFDKIREEISSKLEELNVKNADTILHQILGPSESGKISNDSLVDQKNEVKFREVLATWEKKWPVAFRNWFSGSTDNSDRSLSETIKKCMLRPVRISAGLGNPPIKYSNKNNCSKFVNDAVTELESVSDSVDLVKIYEIMKLKAVESQITEFVKAMYNMGELRLANAYQHLKVSLLS